MAGPTSQTELHTRSQRLLDFAIRSWAATPKMEIEDAYKWLFHATQGGEHAVLDDEGPRQWLDSEWRGLAPASPGEPEVVALDPHGGLLRVNLRPYRSGRGDREMLLAIFVESAKRFKADKKSFRGVWDLLGVTLQRRSVLRLGHRDWKRLDLKCAKRGYPAIEHSAAYLRAYRPAYRVVLGSMWMAR